MRDPRFAEANAWEQHNRPSPSDLEKLHDMGRAVAVGPVKVALLLQAEKNLENRAGIWQAFHDGFISSANEDEPRRQAWKRELLTSFDGARNRLFSAKGKEHEQDAIRWAIEDWSRNKDSFSAWGNRDLHNPFDAGPLGTLGANLLRLVPETGLRALETLRHPALANDILHFFKEDRSAIEVLIPAAPLVFDGTGNWVEERCVTALLVLHLVTEHADALYGAVSRPLRMLTSDNETATIQQAIDKLQNEELPIWMGQAFAQFLKRPDGPKIAVGYLSYLSRQRLLRREIKVGTTTEWAARDAALAMLATELTKASVDLKAVRDIWAHSEKLAHVSEVEDSKTIRVKRRNTRDAHEFSGEGARTLRAEGLPFLHGAAVMLGDASSASTVDLTFFWSWFEELLIGRDPGLSLSQHGTSPTEISQHFGFLLSRLPNPDECLWATYCKLEPHRRRSLYAFRYSGELYHDLESVLLLRVGLNACTNWMDRVKAGTDADAARDLFFRIHAAARRLWLTAVLDTGDTKQQLVGACYAFMPFLFGNKLGDALKRTLPSIANDHYMLGSACTMLRLNGIEAHRLKELVADAGADLPAALGNACQWSDLTGQERHFPEHFRRLAEELGLPISARESP